MPAISVPRPAQDADIEADGAGATSCVLVLIDAVACAAPDAIALRHGPRQLGYGELTRLARARASALRRLGLQDQEPVAIVMRTGIDYIVAMLAVLHAGGAYLPLSPAQPAARMARMLAQAGCTRVLADDAGRQACDGLGAQVSCIALGELDAPGQRADERCEHADLQPYPPASHTACVIFTSGSTGDPKGVRTLHGNLASYAAWSARFFAETASSRVPLTASPNYAAATSQIYACLCAGGTLDILDDALGQPDRLLAFFASHPDHALHTVPTVWRALLHRLERGTAGRPRALFLSGEHLPQELVDRTFALYPDMPVWNLYGPTECVANISAARLERGRPVVIGRPIPGSRLFVVDDAGRELGEGEVGRLLIAGPGVCPGYLVEQVQAPFFTFVDAGGGHVAVYDTGDLARRIGDVFELLGRRDSQVKLRGVRIELADVEANLLRHAGVAQAAVLFDDTSEPRLVAFVEAKPGAEPSAGELARHMRSWLPASMLPELWVLQDLPQLPNGKIDRAALRARLPQLSAMPRTGVATGTLRGSAEHTVAALFSEVLGLDGVGAEDDFFALGGNSLKAFALLAAIEARLGVRLSFSSLYAAPTVAGVAARIDGAAPSAASRPDARPARLSQAQNGLWLLQQAYPEDRSYNLCYRIELDFAIDADAVREVVARLCERHALLRCGIVASGGEPQFSATAFKEPPLTVLDLRALPDADREAGLARAMQALAETGLAEEDKPLHRWLFVQLGPRRQVLGLVVHHLVFDGVSASVLFEDLHALLQGEPLAPCEGTYFDFVAREQQYLRGEDHARDREFWSNYLSGLAAQPGFPVRYRAPQGLPSKGGKKAFTLDPGARERLAGLARREGRSLHVLLLAGFAAMLDRYEPSAEFLVAVPFANRMAAADSRVVGYFTSPLFYRLQWPPGVPLRTLAARLHEDTVCLLDHQRLPFPELAALLREQLRGLPPSTFRLMFGYHDTSSWKAAGHMRASEHFPGQVKCDLHLECFDDGECLEVSLSYRHGAMDASAADDWLDAYRDLLEDLGAWLDAVPERRPALSRAQEQAVLKRSRGACVPEALTHSVAELFMRAAVRWPERPALWHEGSEMSYADLARQVALLAAQFSGRASGAPIGICMPHQPALVAAMLACVVRGVPYVPLDPSLPAQRMGVILEQAGVDLLLVGDGSPDIPLPAGVGVIVATQATPEQLAAAEAPALEGAGATPDSLQYVIYTSGSTGTPKGVMVSQRTVANYLLWMQSDFSIGPDSRILAKTSIGFDISTWELMLPLIGGGCVVLAGKSASESPEALARVIARGGANVVQFVPSGLRLFVEAGMLGEAPCVELIFCGGEALPPDLVDRVRSEGWRGRLYNLYGPTEASIFMTSHDCGTDSPYAAVPIGKPIQNSALYVLDAELRLLPPNAAGDLYIGGSVLAQGYWRDEEKTRAVFIDAPAWIAETRLYRTGDKGRLLSDGCFEFLGRDDQQVKIRGYRVELAEIVEHLRAHENVQDAVAFTRQWGANDLRLHAAVVMRKGVTFDPDEFSAWLKARLPAWMLPSTLTPIAGIPRLVNGKTDFHALRRLVEQESEYVAREAVPVVKGKVEEAVAQVWQAVLGHAKFSPYDSFFEAGGHSMLLLKLREQLRKRLNVDFTIAELYRMPNITEQVHAFRRKIGEEKAEPIVARVRERVARRRSRQLSQDISS